MSIGPFRLLSQLGEGGMGCVYLAVDGRCGRRVAVKCLSPGRRSAEFTSSLAREARLLSRLQHPHIVQLLEFNMDHDPPYLVLELAEEGSLRKVLKQRTLDQQQSVLLMAAVARAVHAAHESGVLHLDLKPENILLTAIPAGVNTFRRMGDRFGAFALVSEGGGFRTLRQPARARAIYGSFSASPGHARMDGSGTTHRTVPAAWSGN
jgi:serine/threonine protein kinase